MNRKSNHMKIFYFWQLLCVNATPHTFHSQRTQFPIRWLISLEMLRKPLPMFICDYFLFTAAAITINREGEEGTKKMPCNNKQYGKHFDLQCVSTTNC